MNNPNIDAAMDAIEAAEDAAIAGDAPLASAWAQIAIARSTLGTVRGPDVRAVQARTAQRPPARGTGEHQ